MDRLRSGFEPYNAPLDEVLAQANGHAEANGARGQAGKGRPPKFILQKLSDLKPVLENNWLIKGLLPAHGLAVVYGAPSVGKSFVALDAMIHVAMGRPWAARKVKAAGVVYVASEGGTGFHNRAVAARTALGADGDVPFSLVTKAPNLGVAIGDVPELLECVREQMTVFGWRAGVVVLDTLARSIQGADENSARDIGIFVANADMIARELGVVVVAVHHTGKAAEKGMRGSSALHGAADAEWEVSDGEAGRKVRLAKMKDAPSDLAFKFDLKSFEVGRDEDGDAVTTCTVDLRAEADGAGAQASTKARPPWSGTAKLLKSAIERACLEHGKIMRPFGAVGPEVRAVPRDRVRTEFMAMYSADDPAAKRQALKRLLDKALSDKLVAAREINGADWLWLVRGDDP